MVRPLTRVLLTTSAIAVDWSGHGNHGTLIGDPQWVAGFDGGALEFGGDNYVDTGYTENLATWTIACWVKSPQAPSGAAASASGPMHRESNYQFNWNHQTEIYRSGAAVNVGAWHGASYAPLQANRWYHLAATFDGNALIAYRDGVLITTNMAATGTPAAESNSLKFARHAAAAQFFTGTVDEARVYNRALTAEEIQQIMKGDTSIAWSPNPGNGTMLEIGEVLPLGWSAGDNAAQHDVYFGTDKDAVATADASDASGIYRGRQSATTFNPAEGVEWGGGPYYWRVDEYNTDGTIGTGKIWTFAVTDYLLVEDFEGYNNYPPDEIWNTWIDGFQVPTNGALVGYGDDVVQAGGDYAETTIVNSGAQSMPLFFDNNLVTSEATETLAPADNWTREGVAELSVWIRGDSANPAERVYVALNGVALFHDDPAIVQATSWTEWRIPLSAFSDKGVNLAAITTVSVGLGDKNNLTAGGSGVLYVDDIRLYRPGQ
ncbi:MAG: LamG domain-containing protein [Phycisphaerae bacterium]|nr:LamG domain-containing protein [Phycisphaerae bacterium]